jgi:hypothetical protein
MATLNRLLTALFDVIYTPLNPLPRWCSLTLLSVLAGLVALLVVKYTSNQAAIARIKDDIKAHMLAIKLFKDDLGVMFGAQAQLIWAALRMQYRMLPPLVIMFVPFVLMAAQMGLRYQWRPLKVGETVCMDVVLSDQAQPADFDLQCPAQDGVEIVGLPVRGLASHMVTWRIRPQRPGVHTLVMTHGRETFTKQLAVGENADRACPVRGGTFWDRLLYPAEAPFEAASLVRSIRLVPYPERRGRYAGADWWLFWFFAVSVVAALVLKPVLKVKL